MKQLLLLLAMLPVAVLSAQSGKALIRGNVYEKESGSPISFASVSIVGTSHGDETDDQGFFSIADLSPGTYQVVVSYIGFNEFTYEVTVRAGGINYKAIYLEDSGVQLEQIEVSGQREAAKTEVRISKVTVTPKQIKALPSTSGDADIAQYLTVLPGVITSGDQGGQIFIRGGSPIQNKILLDGITIYNPFHSIGFFSVFETETVRSADIFTGGFNAEYAGRISAVVDIKTREGNKKRLSGIASVSPFQSKLLIEGPIARLKEDGNGGSTSFILTGKHSYLDRTSPVLYPYATENGQGLPFGFTDLYGKLSFVSGNGSKLNLFGFNFNDRVAFDNSYSLNWNTFGAGTNFLLIPASTNLVIGGYMSYSNYDITFDEGGNAPRNSSIDGFNVGLDFSYYGANTEIKYGVEVSGFQTALNFRTPLGLTIDQTQNNTELGGFVKFKQRYGKLVLEPGLRVQYYASISEVSIEPRLGAKVNVTDGFRLKFAGGIYSQNLISTVSERDVVNLFVGFLSGPDEQLFKPNSTELADTKLQKAIHGIAGVEIDLTERWELNVEPYIKRFSQLIGLNRNKREVRDPNYISETGNAYGIDFLLKYNDPNQAVWATYSLGYVDRNDGRVIYPATFDRRHNINLLYTRTFGKQKAWEASVRWNFGTGFPFTLTQGFYHGINFLDGVDQDYLTQNNDISIIYSDKRNGGRLSAFHRLDASVKHNWKIGKYTRLESTMSVTNIYDRNNIFYLERLTNKRIYQLPILPSISLALFF